MVAVKWTYYAAFSHSDTLIYSNLMELYVLFDFGRKTARMAEDESCSLVQVNRCSVGAYCLHPDDGCCKHL
jgi:hypothetical protein